MKLQKVPVDRIRQLTPLIRLYRGEDWVNFLAEDIRKHGMHTPPHLIKKGEYYSPIDGWHRCRAAKKAGLKEIWAFVYEEDEVDPEILGFRLNMLQRSLDPISIAEFINNLRHRRGYSWRRIQEITGFSERHCMRFLKLLELDEKTKYEIAWGLRPAFSDQKVLPGKRQNVTYRKKPGEGGVRCPICGAYPSRGGGHWIYICSSHQDAYEATMTWLTRGGWREETEKTKPKPIKEIKIIGWGNRENG